MCVKRSMYVAGFERGVRPIGFWSMSITLSKTSIPSTESWSPGLTRILLQPVRERLVDDLVHERRLARAGDAGHVMNFPTGNSTSMPFRLCIDAPRTVNEPLSSSRRGGIAIVPLAGEELTGDGLLVLHHVLRRAFRDDLAAVLARARPHVDEPVGGAHHLLVVLDDENGVAEIAEPLERRDQPAVVALVQSDRRLVEDVEDADELRSDLGREPKPLRLAAGERLRGAVELEVADADVVEERQPLADLLDDPVADQLLRPRSARARRGSRASATPTCA